MYKRHLFSKASVLVAAALFSLSFLGARALTVEDAILLASENSSTLKTAEITLQTSLNEAGVNTLLPSVDISLSAQEATGNMLEGTFFQPITLSFSPSVSWSFSTTYFNSSDSKKLDMENAYLTYASTVATLRSSTESTYWTIAKAYQSVATAEDTLKTAEDNLKKTEALYENSKASSLSLKQAELNVSDAELSLSAAKETYEEKLASFRCTLGLEEGEELILSALPDVSGLDFTKLEDVIASSIDNTTAIRSAELKVRMKEQSAKTTKDNATIPTVSVSTNLNYSVNQELKQNLKFTATAKVTVPVNSYIPNSSSAVSVENARLNVEKEAINAATTRTNLETKLSTSVTAIETSLKKRGNLALHLELAEENLSLVTAAYDAGYSSYSSLVEAEKSLTSARNNIQNNNNSILSDLITISGLLEMDLNTLLEALK